MILNNDVSDILSNSEAEKLGFRKNVMSDFAMPKSTLLRNAANGKSCYIPHPFADNHKLKSPAIHPAISIYIFIVFFWKLSSCSHPGAILWNSTGPQLRDGI